MERKLHDQLAVDLFPGAEVYMYMRGRVALNVALEAIGVSEGDEVILPAYTCSILPMVIRYFNATPVYVDIRSGYNTDPQDVLRAITPRTRAIIVQHTYGIPVDLNAIRRIADTSHISVIEDCCHICDIPPRAPIGQLGDFAFFSFQFFFRKGG